MEHGLSVVSEVQQSQLSHCLSLMTDDSRAAEGIPAAQEATKDLAWDQHQQLEAIVAASFRPQVDEGAYTAGKTGRVNYSN